MASREEQKRKAREEREVTERAAASKQQRKRRLAQLGGVIALAAVVVVVAVVISSSGGSDSGGGGGNEAAEVTQLFAGIPQDGYVLGQKDAPVTLMEYLDPQCPFCQMYSTQVLPTVINNYVRTGKVKIEMQPLRFIGPDSRIGAAAVTAAALQDRGWQFLELFYRRAGQENSGYVDDKFLTKLRQDTMGLDASQASQALNDPAVEQKLTAAENAAQALGINSTPSFAYKKDSGQVKRLDVQNPLDPADFTKALDGVLGGTT